MSDLTNATEEKKPTPSTQVVDGVEVTQEPNPVIPSNTENVKDTQGDTTPPKKRTGDEDEENAQALIIASLRAQNNELFSQVTALNTKLVRSYDRVSDLEDSAHLTQSELRQASIRVAQLETERMDHLKALNTGLLVEKENVTAELSRLMEKVSEEAARRGQAESARNEIEKDLEDLSATLFDQANRMVAEARFNQAKSERKVSESELALKGAEEAVGLMQTQMQSLTESKEAAESEATRLQELVSKGKSVERPESSVMRRGSGSILGLGGGSLPRLFSGHLPLEEFLLFVAHLRTVRPTNAQSPALSSLVSLPFLARLIAEDSDPTLRLDLAPSLNWLTRRTIQTAVQQGQLQVEPLSSPSFLMEYATHFHGISPNGYPKAAEVSCALCGKAVFPPVLLTTSHPSAAWEEAHPAPPQHPASTISSRPSIQGASAAWASTSRFLKNNITLPSLATSSSNQSNISTSVSQSRDTTAPSTPTIPSSPSSSQYQVFVFRLSLPPPQKTGVPYPLCYSGWCLARLRTTCELWRFVRKDVVDRVWEEEDGAVLPGLPRRGSGLPSLSSLSGSLRLQGQTQASAPRPDTTAPPVPPRRKVGAGMAKVGSLFGKGLGALGVDMNSSSTNGRSQEKDNKIRATAVAPSPVDSKDLPAPPHSAGHSDASHQPAAPGAHPASAPPLPTRSQSRIIASSTEPPSRIPTMRTSLALSSDSADGGLTAPARYSTLSERAVIFEDTDHFADGKEVPPEPVKPAADTIDLNEEPSPIQKPVVKDEAGPPGQEDVVAPVAVKAEADPARPVTPAETPSPASPQTPKRISTPPSAVRRSADAASPATNIPPVPRRAARRPLPPPVGGAGPHPASPKLGAVNQRAPSPAGNRSSSPAVQRPGSPTTINRPSTPTRSPKRASVVLSPKLGLIIGAKENAAETKRNSIDAILAGGSPSLAAAVVGDQVVKDSPLADPQPATEVPPAAPEAPQGVASEASSKEAGPAVVHPHPTPSTEASRSNESFASAVALQEPIPASSAPAPEEDAPSGTPKMPVQSIPSEEAKPVPKKLIEPEAQSVSSVYSKTADGEHDKADELEDALGNFVGDRTWEERAWKELVRLRAEMFWARVGSTIR